jgi:hypothetical protein
MLFQKFSERHGDIWMLMCFSFEEVQIGFSGQEGLRCTPGSLQSGNIQVTSLNWVNSKVMEAIKEKEHEKI